MRSLCLLALVAVAAANLRGDGDRKHAIEPNDPRDPDFKGTHVTGDFCLQMLKDVQEKKAPYFAEGAFTKECRDKLKDECHDRICGWKKMYECAKNTPCPCKGVEDVITIPTKMVSTMNIREDVQARACSSAQSSATPTGRQRRSRTRPSLRSRPGPCSLPTPVKGRRRLWKRAVLLVCRCK